MPSFKAGRKAIKLIFIIFTATSVCSSRKGWHSWDGCEAFKGLEETKASDDFSYGTNALSKLQNGISRLYASFYRFHQWNCFACGEKAADNRSHYSRVHENITKSSTASEFSSAPWNCVCQCKSTGSFPSISITLVVIR